MRTLNSRKGSALLIALLAIVILSGLAIVLVKRVNMAMSNTVRYKSAQSAFTATEAGLEHGRITLNDNANNADGTNPDGNWDAMLAAHPVSGLAVGAQCNPWAVTCDSAATSNIKSVTVNGRQLYNVCVCDNSDTDPNLSVDADNRIWLVGNGESGSGTKMVTRKIVALIENDAQDQHIAQEHYGEANLGWAKAEAKDVAGSQRGSFQ
ncbi:MAG: hypothetical protein HZB29_02715 [Nitrospinae bacterium]|nr:hypothetical protein [Nitrospinota bacterium]